MTSAPPPSRVVIPVVHPVVDGGRHPVKRVVGEPIDVEAVVLADGHDELHVVASLRPVSEPGGTDAAPHLLATLGPVNAGLDRWGGRLVPDRPGRFEVVVTGWIDEWASWASLAARKLDAGAPPAEIEVELAAGAELARRLAARSTDRAARDVLRAAADALASGDRTPVRDAGVAGHARTGLGPEGAMSSDPVPVHVERERARFSTWYELFPRSWASEPGRHGTLADVAAQIGYVADLGFDVLYLPPIHPIGEAFRKGPDNSETAAPGDPGSPWAIGNTADPGDGPDGGGHRSIHPALGTHADLERLVVAAADEGIELALDLAFQCSPDHPWVRDHPDWFSHRPDGSIRYAENPPKKYQDVYPLDFGCADWQGLWAAGREVVRHWVDHGISIFRVDNPHTKPFAFWEWLIADVHRTHPDVLFLSEAFTRPEIMHRLTTIGFTLSYSYFPWRRSKEELEEYFTELARAPGADRFRPSAWPNTPDILAEQLWGAPPALFELRYLLAATLSPSVGIYGPAYELCDNADAGNGKEEYARSEKYEIKTWDRTDPGSIAPAIAELNAIRHEHLAFRTLRTLRFHTVGNDRLLAFSKTPDAGPSVDPARPAHASVLVVANLDPHGTQAGTVDLDLAALGVDPARPFQVHDLVADRTFTWSGPSNYVELRPTEQVGHVFRVLQDHP